MKKVIVIGCPGSGKSVFSRALHAHTGLPLYHLDLMYWNPDRTTVSRDEFRRRLTEVLSRQEWIIDGNYNATMELRIAACDTIVFLDFPAEICLDGIRQRKGKPRSDMPWTETEDDAEFLEFIKNYNTESRPKVLLLLDRYQDRRILVFHDREEADAFLAGIQTEIP